MSKGLCYCCGVPAVEMRMDKKGRPWLFCTSCGARLFARGGLGAFRTLARMIMDAAGGFPAAAVESSARALGAQFAAAAPAVPAVPAGVYQHGGA